MRAVVRPLSGVAWWRRWPAVYVIGGRAGGVRAASVGRRAVTAGQSVSTPRRRVSCRVATLWEPEPLRSETRAMGSLGTPGALCLLLAVQLVTCQSKASDGVRGQRWEG